MTTSHPDDPRTPVHPVRRVLRWTIVALLAWWLLRLLLEWARDNPA